ncbi:uncharacterized protein [Onthophagus taurus]|uniref:uncharacterized protein n=1 Tax=Onthophagus taurus TaxID=166361 RepID=UPI0039BDB004
MLPCDKVGLPIKQGTENLGIPYERQVILYLASIFDGLSNIQDFHITRNTEGLKIFEDIIIKCSYRNSPKKQAHFFQLKHSKKKLLLAKAKCKLKEYAVIDMKACSDDIKKLSSQISGSTEKTKLDKFLEDVDEHYFYIFTNILEVDAQDGSVEDTKVSDNVPLTMFGKILKCHFKGDEFKKMFVINNQPDIYSIEEKILETLGNNFTIDVVPNIIEQISNYMNNVTSCNPLDKYTFDCICFQQLIQPFLITKISDVIEMSDHYYQLWNSLIQKHNLISIGEENDKLPLIAFYYETKIKVYDNSFNWRDCKQNNFQLTSEVKTTFRELLQLNINQKINSITDLLVWMWWNENWPLIVDTTKSNRFKDILTRYIHLEKHFILLCSKENLKSFKDLTVFQNISNVDNESYQIISKLLVSLQGRPLVSLGDVIGNNENTRNNVMFSHLLQWSQKNYYPVIGNCLGERKNDYIQRRFQNESNLYTEQDVVEDVINHHRFSIISNDTGMGKSTVLHSLSLRYNPKDVAVLINLADLKDLNKWKKEWKTVYDYFYDKIQSKEDSLFKAIYHDHQSNGRLCFFMDSFEEILAAYESHIIEILDKMLLVKDVKVLMTTRCYAKYLLNDVNYIELVEFTQEEINDYCRHNNISIDLINKHQILTNALHLSILPIVYENIKEISDWDVTDLYREFIKIQLSKYISEKVGLKSINEEITVGESIRREQLDIHHKLSLVASLKPSKLIELYVLKPGEIESILNNFRSKISLGLISSIDNKGIARFVHNAYADYLRADWFYKNSLNERFSELYIMLLESHFLSDTVHFLNMMANSGKNKAIAAIINGDYDAVIRLIKSKDDCLLKPDDLGRYPIHIAAWYSKNSNTKRIFKEIHKYVHETKNQILTENDNFKLTWINYMQAGKTDFDLPEKIKNEIEDGADVNNLFVGYDHNLFNKKRFPTGMNVLHYAISFSTDLNFIQYLLDNGADRFEVEDGKNALIRAITDSQSPDILKLLLKHKVDEKAIKEFLHSNECAKCAVSSKSVFAFEMFEVLIKCGLNPSLVEKDDFGRTCLHFAASSPSDDSYKIVEKLLKYMDPNETDNCGKDARYYSTLSSSENADKIIKLLIHNDDDITTLDNDGLNYFHYIVLSHSQISNKNAEFLLRRKINPNTEDKFGRNCLHLAALSNSPNSYLTVKLLLDYGMDPKKKDKSGRNPLHFAALSSSINSHKTTELLLNYNIEPYEKDNLGKISFHYATLSQSENACKIVDILLKQNLNPNFPDNDGKSCLHFEEFYESKYAYKITELLLNFHLNPNNIDNEMRSCLHIEKLYYSENARKIIQLLLNHGLNPNLPDKNGQICLHYHKLYDSESARKTIKLLLEHNLNPNHLNNEGKTCLHNKQIFYMDKSRNIVELLLQHGLDPNISDKDGKNCLQYEELFYSDNAREMINLLLKFGLDATKTDNNYNNCLHSEKIHYSDNSRKMVELLLKHGLNPNQKNLEGKICLHYQALYYSENARKMAELLLRYNLNPNILDAEGKNCLHYKELYLSEYARNMFKLLLENGLDPNVRDGNGNHCLHYALQVNNEHVYGTVELLCEYLDFSKTNDKGESYLHEIASSPSENAHKILSIILKRNVDLNIIDKLGRNVFHHACQSFSPNSHVMVQLLLDQGEIRKNINMTDFQENTYLHYACYSGSENVMKTVKILLNCGIDVFKENKLGQTCLYHAVTSKSPKSHKVVKRLLKCGLKVGNLDASLSPSIKAHKIKAVFEKFKNE